MRLANKTALITGGNSGIGFATARLFLAEGASVAITGRNQKTLDAAIAELGNGLLKALNIGLGIGVERIEQIAELLRDGQVFAEGVDGRPDDRPFAARRPESLGQRRDLPYLFHRRRGGPFLIPVGGHASSPGAV